MDSTTALWLPNFNNKSINNNNESQSQLNQVSTASSTSDWLGGIFPSCNVIHSSGKLLQKSMTKRESCETNDRHWNLLDNWNSESTLNSISEFKWDALDLVENENEKKSELFGNCLNTPHLNNEKKKVSFLNKHLI